MNGFSIRYTALVGMMLVSLVLSACGAPTAPPLLPTPTGPSSGPAPTLPGGAAPTPASTAGEQPPAVTPGTQTGSQWVVFTDAHWGYSVAVPCWWPLYPARSEGVASSSSLASYDEAYFIAHSVKGQWLGGMAPPGAVKLDLTTMLQISPDADTEDLLKNSLTGGNPGLVNSMEEVTLGANQGWKVVVRSEFNPEDTATVYAFRPSPDRLFMVAAYPQSAASSRDVQAIIASLSFSPDQPVQLPDFPPSSPIIPVPQNCTAPNIISAP